MKDLQLVIHYFQNRTRVRGLKVGCVQHCSLTLYKVPMGSLPIFALLTFEMKCSRQMMRHKQMKNIYSIQNQLSWERV